MEAPAPTSTYLPDDAPWRKYNLEVLKQQCTARNLPVEGRTKRQLQARLVWYHQARLPAEPRPEPWIFKPLGPTYSVLLNRAQVESFQVVKIRDITNQVGGGPIKRMAFLIAQHGAPELFTVTFCDRPTCTCNEYLLYRCVHIIYVLRYVLNVPEPLRWQRAFLCSEVMDIYKRSHPVKALVWRERYTAIPGLCLMCFKGQAYHRPCLTCNIGVHLPCLAVVNRHRQTPESRVCTVCVDKHEWNIIDLRPEIAERRAIERGRAVAEAEWGNYTSGPSSDSSEEEGDSSSEGDSSDEDSGDEVSRGDEQSNSAPGQAINQRGRSPPILIKQGRSSPPPGQQLPSSPPLPQQQQPASSPLRRKQPSRAAKDIGLVRHIAAAAEAPARTPRRSQGRTPTRTPASSQPVNVPAQSITPIPVPVIPAQALLQIQQVQQQQIRQAVHNFEAGRPQSGASSALRGLPFSAPRALPFAVIPPQDPAIQASATPAPDPAPHVQEPVALAASAAPQGVEAAAAPAFVPEPGSAVHAGSPAHTPATTSASINTKREKRKATKLARKLKSLARESAYVREHAGRELKRLAKESKRLEKKVKALAKRNEAGGDA